MFMFRSVYILVGLTNDLKDLTLVTTRSASPNSKRYVTEQASQGNTRDINLKRDVPQTIKVRATEKKYWHMCVLKIYCSKKCGVPLWHARCAIGVSRWDERPDVRAAPSSLARPLLCHFSFCHVSLRACGIFSVRHARAWHTR